MEIFTFFEPILPSIITGVVAFIIACHVISQKKKFDKINNTIKFEDKYQHNNEIRVARKSYDEVFSKNDSCKTCVIKGSINCHYKNDSNKLVNEDLNALETVANGIYYEAYDSNYLYCSFGNVLQQRFINYIPLILTRFNTRDDRGNRPYCDASIKLCWLMFKWSVEECKYDDFEDEVRIKKTFNIIDSYIKETCILDDAWNITKTFKKIIKKISSFITHKKNPQKDKYKKLDEICEYLCWHHFKNLESKMPLNNKVHLINENNKLRECFCSVDKQKCWNPSSGEDTCRNFRFER